MDIAIEDQLYDAISLNDENIVRKTLRKDVNINTICSSGLTPLGAAAHLGNISICEILIENYHRFQNREDCTSHKNKKLCLSLDKEKQYKNDKKNIGYYVVRKDLDTNNDENLEIGDGPTPEGMEALEWDVEIKETDDSSYDESYSSLYQWYADILNRTSDLLKTPLPCDINQIDRYGRTAMHYASDQGHVTVVQLLLSNGCNVNHTCSSESMSPLHLASSKGHSEVVSLLVKAGARVDHITNTKATPLHLASSQGHIKVMQILLQSGANVDAVDSSDRTPLVRAVALHKVRAVEILVRHGAKVNIEDINGHTPLCEAVWMNSISMAHSLISAGAKITQSHYLLHFAVLNNQLEIVKLLIKTGSVVNLRDNNGNTPLILAARSGHTDTAKYLLDHGAMVNLPNSITGSTALYEAVEFLDDYETENKSILDLLVHRGADLEIQTNWETPLYRAIFMEKTQIASVLIRYGCNVNFCDPRMNIDNICIVRKNNNFPIAKMLVFAGYDLSTKTDICRPSKPIINIKNVYDWLVYTKYNPLSLMNICRIRIRKQLGKKVYFKINSLGLPRSLVSFLNLEHIN